MFDYWFGRGFAIFLDNLWKKERAIDNQWMPTSITHVTDTAFTHPVVDSLAALSNYLRGKGDADHYNFALAGQANK
jgi:hypothetical protein